MESAAKFAGFLAAHAIWSTSDGETLIPMLGFETAEGTRNLHRFVAETAEKGLSFDGPASDYQVAGSAFFEGVDSHEKAAPIWSRYSDIKAVDLEKRGACDLAGKWGKREVAGFLKSLLGR